MATQRSAISHRATRVTEERGQGLPVRAREAGRDDAWPTATSPPRVLVPKCEAKNTYIHIYIYIPQAIVMLPSAEAIDTLHLGTLDPEGASLRCHVSSLCCYPNLPNADLLTMFDCSVPFSSWS